MRFPPAHAAPRGSVPPKRRIPKRLRTALSVAVAGSFGLVPTVMVASPAQAVPIPNLTVSDAETFEGGKASFTVTYGGSGTSGPITFATGVTGVDPLVDAVSTVDFAATPSVTAYTFPGGGGAANTVTVTVQTLVDGDTNDAETFQLVADNGADDPVAGTGTIRESPVAVSDLNVSDATTWEGGKASFMVTYAGAGSSGPVTFVAANMGDGATAESGTDYTATPSLTSYTFPGTVAGGTNTVTVTVQTLVDGDATASEDFRLTAATTGRNASTGTGTIFESPATNEIVLSGATTVPETATGGVQKSVTITATSTNPQPYDIVIPVKTADFAGVSYITDMATSAGGANRDYTALSSGATIVIPADQTVGTLKVALWDDTSDEAETQYFNVEADASRTTLGGAVLAGQDVVKIGVKDDDAKPTISIGDAATAKEGGRLTFPLTLSNPTELGVAATLTAQGVATGSAAAAVRGDADAGVVDFVWDNTPGTVTVPAYAKSTNVMIPVTEKDATFEGPENVRVTLSDPDNATLGTPATANGLITDMEAGQTVEWSTVNDPFANGTRAFAEGDAGTTDKKIYVKFATGTLPTTLDYTFADVNAKNGEDYVGTAGSITVPAFGAAAVSIPVVIKGDRIDEPDETFKLVVTDPSGVANSADIGEVSIEITDNDDAPTWTTEDVSIQEGNSGTALARIPVKLSGPASADATFTATFNNDGSAVDPASTPGTNDFNQPSTTDVTIKAGETVGYLDVPVNGDEIYERDESFTVEFSAPAAVNDVSPDTVRIARVTIGNNDALPKVTFGQFSGLEGGTVEVTGTVVGASQYEYEIGFAAAGSGDYPATSGGVDFTSPTILADPVTIPAGFTGLLTDPLVADFVPLSFSLKNDNIDEATETFAVTASEATSSLKGFATSVATVKIADDSLDLPPTVSIVDVSIGENEQSVDVAVNLTFKSDNDATSTTQTVTVPYWTEDGSAKAGQDFTAKQGTLSIPAGTLTKMINVPIKTDNLTESNENFFVKLGTPGPLGATLGKAFGEAIIKANTGTTDPTDPTGDAPTLKSLASFRLGAGKASLSGTAGAGATVELWGRNLNSDADDYAKITQTTASSSGVFAFQPAMTTDGKYFMVKSGGQSSAAIRVFIRQDPDISATATRKGAARLVVTGDPKLRGLQAKVFRVNAGGRLTLVGSGRLTAAGTFTKTLTGLASGRSYTYKSYIVGDGPRGVLTGYSSYSRTVRIR